MKETYFSQEVDSTFQSLDCMQTSEARLVGIRQDT